MSFVQPQPPNSFEIDVPCANCGSKTKKPLGWLRENNEFVCGNCGTLVDECRRIASEFDKTSQVT